MSKDQPRVPAGNPNGGQWTSNDNWSAHGVTDAPEISLSEKLELDARAETLSTSSRKALGDYYVDYSAINKHLRGVEQDPWWSNLVAPKIAELDAAFTKENLKLTERTTVYRGMSNQTLNLEPGDIIHDKGFVSTTKDPQVARDYSSFIPGPKPTLRDGEDAQRQWFSKMTIIQIDLPKGQSYLPGASGHSEFVLPRNIKFKVTHKGVDLVGRNAYRMEPINE